MICVMPVGRAARFEERKPRVVAAFGSNDEVLRRVAEVFALLEMAWHDCYGPEELEVPLAVLDDVLLLAEGDLAKLVGLALSAVIDFRDVRVAADARRAAT